MNKRLSPTAVDDNLAPLSPWLFYISGVGKSLLDMPDQRDVGCLDAPCFLPAGSTVTVGTMEHTRIRSTYVCRPAAFKQ